MNSRREFIIQLTLGSAALIAQHASAESVMVLESDPQPAALGYKADASKVDTKKFPNYVVGHQCSNCSLYQGKPADASGPCPLFMGKQVASKGWCNAWSKKA